MQGLYESSQFIERQVYTSVPGEAINTFDFVTIKPLGRSPQGHLLSTALAVAFENGIVKIYDIHFQNTVLLEIVVGKDILQVGSSGSQDDMFIVILTRDNKLYIYDVSLERKLGQPSMSSGQKGSADRHLPGDSFA